MKCKMFMILLKNGLVKSGGLLLEGNFVKNWPQKPGGGG